MGGTPPLWPGSLAALRRELTTRGLRLSKRFGQNFMIDPNLARAVVRAAGVAEGDVVLEVGPGAGHLTSAILETGARVVAVEIDAGLCAMLRERLAAGVSASSFRLIRGSVLAKGDVLNPAVTDALREEMPAAGREHFRVASNLPYNVGAAFLIALATSDVPWTAGAVTLQREVAERLVARPGARPGTKAYGASSVMWQLLAEGRIDRVVPPEVFWPRPKVESALFVTAPKKGTVPLSVPSFPDFAGFVKALFSRRRKVLRSAVASRVPSLPKSEVEAAFAAAGIDPAARAEDVEPEKLLALWMNLGTW